MSSVKYGVGLFVLSVCLGAAVGAEMKPSAGFSLDAKKASQISTDNLDSTTYWGTEGTGSCNTGNLTCSATNRQIGCNATGEYVKCEYTSGDVGWVHCYASGGGVVSEFTDQCP